MQRSLLEMRICLNLSSEHTTAENYCSEHISSSRDGIIAQWRYYRTVTIVHIWKRPIAQCPLPLYTTIPTIIPDTVVLMMPSRWCAACERRAVILLPSRCYIAAVVLLYYCRRAVIMLPSRCYTAAVVLLYYCRRVGCYTAAIAPLYCCRRVVILLRSRCYTAAVALIYYCRRGCILLLSRFYTVDICGGTARACWRKLY